MKKRNKLVMLLTILFLAVTSTIYATTIISCSNGDCTTTVHQHENNWSMLISCEDGSSWSGGGSGEWGGTACGDVQ